VEQLLHEVRLQALLEQRQAGPGADVGPERDPDARLDVPAHREQAAAQGRVAGRAVRHPGLLRGQEAELAVETWTLWANTLRGPTSPNRS
jgi:hypothetical protein